MLAAYGSPSGIDDVERYYTCILGGRAPPPPLLDELRNRYAAIGGTSPLTEITRRQAKALRRLLAQTATGTEVRVGMKYSPPFIAGTLAELAEAGAEEVLVLPMTPFSSSVSDESYLRIAGEAAKRIGIGLRVPGKWHMNSHFLTCWKGLIEEALKRKRPDHVVFTAHSIPQKYIDSGETYMDEIIEVSDALSARLDIQSSEIAFQSAGRTRDAWLGPPLAQTMAGLKGRGIKDVLVVPVGFVSEHLEVLYDIDIEAKRMASEVGIHMRRTALPDDREEFIKALADVCLCPMSPATSSISARKAGSH